MIFRGRVVWVARTLPICVWSDCLGGREYCVCSGLVCLSVCISPVCVAVEVDASTEWRRVLE